MSEPDPFLIGNGAWCSGCFPNGPPRGRIGPATWRAKIRPGCNECAGKGRIAFSAAAIVGATIRENRASTPLSKTVNRYE